MKTQPSKKSFQSSDGKCRPGGKRKSAKLGCQSDECDNGKGKSRPSRQKDCEAGSQLVNLPRQKPLQKRKTVTSLSGRKSGGKRKTTSAGKLKLRTTDTKQALPKQKRLAAHSMDPNKKTKRKGLARVKDRESIGGVIYIGHLPKGFMEPQLRGFFSQFGDVKRVRLFRSRKNNHSKGYAFVEFAVSEVAQIAAEAMDKYRMFGRTLVCRVIPREEVNVNVFRELPKNLWRKLLRRSAVLHDTAAQRPPTARALLSKIRKFEETKKKFASLGIELESSPLQSCVEAPDRRGALRQRALAERTATQRKKENARRKRLFIIKSLKQPRASVRKVRARKQSKQNES